MLFAASPGMRVQAAKDITTALGVLLIPRGTTGTVVKVDGWRTVMVQFDAGRCIGLERWALRPIKHYRRE